MSKLHKTDTDRQIANKILDAASTRWDRLSEGDIQASILMANALAVELIRDGIPSSIDHRGVYDYLSSYVTRTKSIAREMIE